MAQKSIILGVVAVTTAGTRKQISTDSKACYAIVLQANSSNTGKIYVGDSTVTSSNGIELSAGDSLTISPQSINGGSDTEINLTDVYIDAQVSGESVRVHYLYGRV